jgi:two-component system, NarL family, invasion response regulator UvrY
VGGDGDTSDISPAGEVSVLLVDDQAPFRSVARTVVDLVAGFTVVGEAASGEEAVAMAADLHPAMVLMDLNLPDTSGIETTRRIVAAAPDTVVMMLSTYRAEDLPSDAATCGAARYVHKEDFGPAVLREIWAERPT